MSESLRKQEEVGKSLYDYLMGLQTYAERQRILEETRMLFTKRENKVKMNQSGLCVDLT